MFLLLPMKHFLCNLCQRQDASRLVDLCRQNIIFDDIADISACLCSISADPDVQIVRVKNRLDPAYKSAVSAGYRDVVLNLKICNERTLDLCVNEQVCEVQLVHLRFAELKVLPSFYLLISQIFILVSFVPCYTTYITVYLCMSEDSFFNHLTLKTSDLVFN